MVRPKCDFSFILVKISSYPLSIARSHHRFIPNVRSSKITGMHEILCINRSQSIAYR